MKRGRSSQMIFLQRILIIVLGITIQIGSAQISPGDLTKAHAKLEGMTNCTKCHVLGDKVSNDKCLECHKEIKNRISQDKGFHASTEVEGKDCFTCHSEHHGRNFEIVRFDIQKFDHQKTGYKLTGAHIKQECSACHQDENIESAEIKSKEYTYLGLKTNCNSCHEDVHQNTLSTDCAACHNTEAFKPAPLFDHNQSEFPLKGKHKEEDCISCHTTTFVNGALFQKFKGIQHASCASCHTDPHEGAFGQKCKDCHSEESFNAFVGKSSFNHTLTQFPLIGKHKKVDCASCHQMGDKTTADRIFKDYTDRDFHNCITCHKDVHETKFGTDCRQCHTEESFQKLVTPDKFQHNLTGYVLEGKHETVDCRKCHINKATDPLPHDRCGDCHKDFHEGQFVRANSRPDCKDCHTLAGFSESSYTIEQHQESAFPLTGAHQATPCFACHLKEEQWSFTNLGTRCIDCHVDVHEGGLDEKYYPQKSCNQCHLPETWAQVTFDHRQTDFELSGKHESIQCVACHRSENDVATKGNILFTGLHQECSACHQDQHRGQFEEEGKTMCTKCHGTDQWKPSQFDHQTARFKLDGAHINVACGKCHKAEMVEDQMVVQYKLQHFECIDCHL